MISKMGVEGRGCARGLIVKAALYCIASVILWPGKAFAQSDSGSGTNQPPAVAGADTGDKSNQTVYVLTKRVTITTDDGVISLDAGARVKLVKDKGATLLVNDGENDLEIDKSYLVVASPAGSSTTAAASGTTAGSLDETANAGGKHADEFTTDIVYDKAVWYAMGANFDIAAEYCEEAYQDDPTMPGVIKLRNMIYMVKASKQRLEEAKIMAKSGQYADGKQGIAAAQQEYDGACKEIIQFAQPERLRVEAAIANFRLKAAQSTIKQTEDEEREDTLDAQNAYKHMRSIGMLIGSGAIVAVMGFLVWVMRRRIY